jgi:uncharacterized protein (TIGR04255 family)
MPNDPNQKFQRAPVVFVLAQVRFPAILKMAAYVPEIQNFLREQGFARYAEEQMQQLIFGPQIKAEMGNRWVFAKRDRREAVVLATNFVVYETSQYDVFGTLAARFRDVLRVIKEQTRVEFADQLGLRYVDLIRQADRTTPRDFLREPLRGLTSDELGASTSQCQFVIQAKTQHGDLFIRSYEGCGSDFMPPDLISTHLDYGVTMSEDDCFRILDFDHISRGEIDFDPDAVLDRIHALHESTSHAFHAAVTPQAIEYWKTGTKQ